MRKSPSEAKPIVAIHIKENPLEPESARGRCYRRVDTCNRTMKPHDRGDAPSIHWQQRGLDTLTENSYEKYIQKNIREIFPHFQEYFFTGQPGRVGTCFILAIITGAPQTHMSLCSEPATVLLLEEGGKGSIIHVTQVQLKMIAIGLIPIFFILTIIMPKNTTTYILLAIVMLTAIGVSFLGWSLEKREAGKDDDLLAIPPKKS